MTPEPAETSSPAAPSRLMGSSRAWWLAAAAALLLGFVDLARGGETIGPILLVIGYCVLVPVAILK